MFTTFWCGAKSRTLGSRRKVDNEIVHVEKSFKTFPVKIAFKVLAYRFVFVFADSSFSKVWRLIESGRQLNHPSVLLDAGLNRERH